MAFADIPVDELWQASRRVDVVAAMDAFYAEADRQIAARLPVCTNKGECCRFAQFGHRLYVTALEVAYYLASGYLAHAAENANNDGENRKPCDSMIPAVTEEVCPHAIGGRCCARDRRPFGCRVFFCDPAAQHWQGPMTEETLVRLRQMHDDLSVPYFYAEWLTVLRALRGE